MSKTYKDIPLGTRFNKLTSGPFVGFNERRNALFEFTCDCGNKKVLPGSTVRLGETKSCGCLPAERMSKLSASLAEDETGKQYGKLLVVRRLEKKHSAGSFLYECRCDCGAMCNVATHNLRNGKRTNCGAWSCNSEMSEVLNEKQGAESVATNAYFSGHFDGEGCISFQRQARCENGFPGLTIRVSAVFKPVVMEYAAYFGGQVVPVTNDSRYKGRLQWLWSIRSQHLVLRFINRILPYSKEKKEQLELGREYLMERIGRHKYLADPETRSKLPALVERMSSLKRFEFTN